MIASAGRLRDDERRQLMLSLLFTKEAGERRPDILVSDHISAFAVGLFSKKRFFANFPKKENRDLS